MSKRKKKYILESSRKKYAHLKWAVLTDEEIMKNISIGEISDPQVSLISRP